LNFLRLGDPKLRDLANLWFLGLTNYYVLKLQEYQLWRH